MWWLIGIAPAVVMSIYGGRIVARAHMEEYTKPGWDVVVGSIFLFFLCGIFAVIWLPIFLAAKWLMYVSNHDPKRAGRILFGESKLAKRKRIEHQKTMEQLALRRKEKELNIGSGGYEHGIT